MNVHRNLAPTPRTVKLAKALIRHTPSKGAEATVDVLRAIDHEQLVPFVALLARYAAAETADLGKLPDLPGASSRAVKPLQFTDAERLAAVRRYNRGDRTPRTVAARSEYQRLWRQAAAARKASAEQDGSAA